MKFSRYSLPMPPMLTDSAVLAARILFEPSGLTAELIKSLIKSNNVLESTAKEPSKSGEVITIEQQRVELTLKHAQIARELAIARRIDTAEEVEIEEVFDTTGDGKAGVQSGDTGFNVGLAGSGRRLSKRTYRFKGWRTGGLELLIADLEKLTPEQREQIREITDSNQAAE